MENKHKKNNRGATVSEFQPSEKVRVPMNAMSASSWLSGRWWKTLSINLLGLTAGLAERPANIF